MAKKNNIRSIRFTDEMAELIDRQPGDTFQAKFDALVTRCVWELPAKNKELARVEDLIRTKREEYRDLVHQLQQLSNMTSDLKWKMESLNRALDRNLEQWDV